MLEIVIQLYGYEIILSALLLENPQSNLTKQRSSQGLVFSFKFSVSSSFILGWHPSLKKISEARPSPSLSFLSLSLHLDYHCLIPLLKQMLHMGGETQ